MAVDVSADSRTAFRVLIASAAACQIAFAASWIQPLLMVELIGHHLTEKAAALVLTVEMLTLAVSSMLFTRLARGSMRTILGVGAVIAIAGNLLSMMVVRYDALLLTRILCGMGEGALLMVSSAAPARFANASSLYGRIQFINVAAGTGLIMVAPFLGHLTGGSAAFSTLLFCMILLFPLLMVMPKSERFVPPVAAPVAVGAAPMQGRTIWLCIAMFAVISGNGAIWAFSFVIGARTGLGEAALSTAMAVAIGCGLGGCLVASVLGDRFGQRRPIIIAIAIATIAAFLLTWTHDRVLFQLCMAIYMFALYVFNPYCYGLAAVHDPSGRAVAMVGSAALLSLAVGPYIGSMVVAGFGVVAMGWLAAGGSIIAMLIFLHLTRAVRQSAQPR